MRADALGLAALSLLAVATAHGGAAATTEEERRRELHDLLKIRQPPPAKVERTDAPDAGAAPDNSAVGETKATFLADARPILERECGGCHRAGGQAAGSRWLLTGDLQADHANTLKLSSVESPEGSQLLRKGTGEVAHAGGARFDRRSPQYQTLVRWMAGGGVFGAKAESPPRTRAETDAGMRMAEAGIGVVFSHEPGTVPDGGLSFAPSVHDALLATCSGCHGPGKPASNSRYMADPEPGRHLERAEALVTPGKPAESILLQRARGEGHPGGAVWAAGSRELELLSSWIASVPAKGERLVAEERGGVSQAPAEKAAEERPPGIALGTYPYLGTFRLNGRFDLSYERLGFNGDPFGAGAQNALRSYHQFLFLTRISADDPVSFTMALPTLLFWEVAYRVSPRSGPLDLSVKGGRLLVPFGGEPLFHHSYGGHAAFDQRVLPPVFARDGVSATVRGRWRAVSLSGDLYAIAGYALRRADGVLDLQSDFAPPEDVRFGFGARLGAALGPLSIWYSPYFNAVGFGRRLLLQAVDVAFWRPRGIRILEHFSLGAGLLRADVSGGAEQGYGGPGADYYHFASYLQLRFYPWDWLYVQYRQGLRTFANRRGLFLDETDLTSADGSTHNVGVVARWRGLSVGLYQYWNLEKVDEVPDDFIRLMVAYDF